MASIHRAREINGITTNLVVHSFADRIIILITQLGKVGCLVGHPHLMSEMCVELNTMS